MGFPGRHLVPMAKATTVDPFRVMQYLPPGRTVDDQLSRSLMTLKPASFSRLTDSATAWYSAM
jgi:hypothetical protein